ncbi:Peroxin-3 [Mycena floridula]|nr:Peroxin-3 [Mycena floridula]
MFVTCDLIDWLHLFFSREFHPNMFEAVKSVVCQRKGALSKVAAAVGSYYAIRHYITDRVEEVKDRLEQERVARTNLKSRFQQTQSDVSYLVLVHITTLSDQILDELDIESLIEELQGLSNSKKLPQKAPLLSSPLLHSTSSGRSDVDSSVLSTPSDSEAVSLQNDMLASVTTDMSTSGLQGWVEANASAVNMSASMTTNSSAMTGSVSIPDSSSAGNADNASSTSSSTSSRTKAELWNQVKISTFTRTLTVLYSTTLLALLTSVQLTVLARYKYVKSVQQAAYDEQIRDVLEAQLSISNLLLGSTSLEQLMTGDIKGILEEGIDVIDVSEEVEAKYLTLSWWILHVGWKDVGERVRRGVEEVLSGVSLKSKLAAIDLFRIMGDIRRRVEYEVTFEGVERRVNFLSSLLPPTPEMTQRVLSQGGFGPLDQGSSHSYLPEIQDPQFASFLSETQTILRSSDFSCVLEMCLDRATDILCADLDDMVFVAPPEIPGEDVRIQLASMLPGLASWSESVLKKLPNELIDNLLGMREVAALSALVFAKFEEQSGL